jgi:hypothetical protein
METTHELLHLRQMKFGTIFICIIIFFNGATEYGNGWNFKLLRRMWNLHKSTWYHGILYADRTTFSKIAFAKYEYGRQLKCKIQILFYGDNS